MVFMEKISKFLVLCYAIALSIVVIAFFYKYSTITGFWRIGIMAAIGFAVLIFLLIFLSEPKKRINYFLAIFVISGCLYACEIVVYPLIFHPSLSEMIANTQRIDPSSMILVNPIMFFRKGNRAISPLGTVANTQTILCREGKEFAFYGKKWAVFKSDEHGFNNPSGLYKKGEIDIALVGDSFTEGYCVQPNQTIAAHLRNSFSRKAISFGIGGAGAFTRLAVLSEYAAFLEPKIVVWVETGNTISRLIRADEIELKVYLKPNFTQKLFSRQEEIDKALSDYAATSELINKLDRRPEWLRSLMLVKVRTKVFEAFTSKNISGEVEQPTLAEGFKNESFEYREDVLDDYRKALVAAKTRVESWGGTFLYFYITNSPINPKRKPDRDLILALVNNLRIPIIDMTPSLEKMPSLAPLYPIGSKGAHFNEKGYFLVAGLIDEFLKNKENLKP